MLASSSRATACAGACESACASCALSPACGGEPERGKPHAPNKRLPPPRPPPQAGEGAQASRYRPQQHLTNLVERPRLAILRRRLWAGCATFGRIVAKVPLNRDKRGQ